jgi:hypothetical protein
VRIHDLPGGHVIASEHPDLFAGLIRSVHDPRRPVAVGPRPANTPHLDAMR